MKVIRIGSLTPLWVVLLAMAALALWLRSLEGRFAAGLAVGGIYVVMQIGGHPDRWRSRGGSLIPALFLIAITWLAIGFAVAMAVQHHR